MSDEAPHLLTQDLDDILIVTLNRPQKLNAITPEMLQLFEAGLERFRDTPQLKVMLIRATGRYFCAGADLRASGGVSAPARSASQIREAHRTGLNGMQRIYDEMEHVEKPIVVAHHAPCIGGGLELSLSCDFRLAAHSAEYGFPEGLFGNLPASNGVSRLTRFCGPHWARYLIMANVRASAAQAMSMGLVHEVFADETFEDEVMAFCRHLAQQDADQMGTAKLAIELAYEVGRDQARQVERLASSALMLNPDYAERMRTYVARLGKSGEG